MTVIDGSATLLGREAEVAQALQVLISESGGCVAVVGAAGIGKSALVREVAAQASEAGVAVRTTVGAVSESDLPFVGLHDLISDDVAAGSVELTGTLRDALDVTVLRTRAADADVDPLTLNLAVLRVMEQLSAERRLLLVLDDLPWVDAASRAALAFVLRRLPPARVSTLMAMRPDSEGADVVDVVAPGTVRTIAVGPLDPDALAAAVGLRGGATLPRRFARQLHELAGGNPLLALELARTATLAQRTLSDLAVPERYRAILSPRLAALSPDARRALLAASLLSRATLEEVAEVAPVDGILEADAAGVVRLEDGRVSFTHPLYAALCRDAAAGGERRDMHAHLAKAASDEIERARHLGDATLLPDEDVAAQLEETAGRARGRAAIAEAAELSLRAERLTPVGDLERRTTRACAAAQLFFQTGDIDTAAAVLRPLLDELEPGPVRARCLALLAEVIGEDSEGAAELLQEALCQPGLDPDLEGELRFASAEILINLGDLDGSGARLATIAEQADASGRADLARRCRVDLSFVDLLTGTPPAASAAWQRMVSEVESYDLSYGHPELRQAWYAMSQEDNARALELIDGLMERARRAGDINLWASFALHRNEAELRRGNIVAARDVIDQAYRILADGRHDEAVLYRRSLTAAWQGRLEDARTDAWESMTMARRDHNRLFEIPAYHALGFVELSAGRLDSAARHYQAVSVGLEAIGHRHPSLLAWHGNAVEAMVWVGRRAEALALTEDLAEMAERYDLATSKALALRCRALLLEDAGELEEAAAALDASVSLSEPLDNPLEHARTLLIRGVVHRRRRQKALSREDLRRARDLFADHGAAVWAARADRELERSAATAAGSELSSSERAVADLAASGSTNREIAASLYLSEKTVEAVLTRVYRKLSVRSRTQLGHHPALTKPTQKPAQPP